MSGTVGDARKRLAGSDDQGEKLRSNLRLAGRIEGLREAADEVHFEARWQTEQKVRMAAMSDIRATLEFGGSIERLMMVEKILRDRADSLRADLAAESEASRG